MKLKCIDAIEPASNGLFGIGASPEQQVDGLTKGKVYEAFLHNDIGGGHHYSVTNDYSFLIFNDNKQWETYKMERFEPA